MSEIAETIEERERGENIGLGILGALLFALIGGGLWVLFFRWNLFHEICAVACVTGAVIGYRLFTKSRSLKGVLISMAAAIIVMLIASYTNLSIDVFFAYRTWFENGQVDHQLSFIQAVAGAYQFLVEPEVMTYCLKELGYGMLFWAVGSFVFVADGIKYYREQKEY